MSPNFLYYFMRDRRWVVRRWIYCKAVCQVLNYFRNGIGTTLLPSLLRKWILVKIWLQWLISKGFSCSQKRCARSSKHSSSSWKCTVLLWTARKSWTKHNSTKSNCLCAGLARWSIAKSGLYYKTPNIREGRRCLLVLRMLDPPITISEEVAISIRQFALPEMLE